MSRFPNGHFDPWSQAEVPGRTSKGHFDPWRPKDNGYPEDNGYPDINGLQSAVPAWYRHLPQMGLLKPRSRRSVSASAKRRVFERDGYRCKYCGTDERLTIDHIIPVSRGGGDKVSNLQTLCGPCNFAKGDQ